MPDWAKDFGKGISDWWKRTAFHEITSKLGIFFENTIGRAAKDFGNRIVSAGRELGHKFLEPVKDFFDGLDLSVGGTTGDIFSKGASALGFAEGTPLVPRNMVARIHQGEAVIPAAQNPNNPGSAAAVGGGGMTVNIYIQSDIRSLDGLSQAIRSNERQIATTIKQAVSSGRSLGV
jgi:hypothetical protein